MIRTPYNHSTPCQTEQYNQMLYDHSTPFQAEHYIPEVYDQRIFPMFPSQGGPMGPPPGPRRGDRVKDHNLEHLPHHPHLSFPLKHNKLEPLPLIRAVLEDVYSDIRMCG